jgi:23S rRNA pseudouridine1911/1915/1917 synthase
MTAPQAVPQLTRVVVPAEAAGERLDRYLASLPEVGSRAAAERLLTQGAALVDGEARPKSHRLAGGEELSFEPPPPESAELEREELPLGIAYEDEHLLVVDKPAGIVVHPAPGHASGTLVHGLVGRVAGGDVPERPGIVHRLDRDTSGLLVVARSEEAYRGLRNLVRRRELERRYKALVRGRPQSWRGRIEAPIGRDRHEPTRMSLDSDTPRDAVTHFEI